jgi:uncharacterized protein YeeX (DUF496 family)
MLRNNINNRIKQPAQCCVICGKTYKKRLTLDKHIVICELLHKSNTSRNVDMDMDEEESIPSPKKMFQMLIELGQKYNKLEEQLKEMNKWIVKKKKKINVLDWLNEHVKPNITFDNLFENFTINNENENEYNNDIKNIIDNSFYDVFNIMFYRIINNLGENEKPIFALAQKNNIYIYDSDHIWVELSKEKIVKLIFKIHSKITKAFYEWQKTKNNEIKSNENFSIICDKTLIKLMNVELKGDTTLTRIKNIIFSKIKTDMKSLIEYEFEF